MPSKNAHLLLAKHNEETIGHLGKEFSKFSDWIAVVAFYQALHIVEALFFTDSGIKHGRSHEEREQFLKRNRRFEKIWTHYRELWSIAQVARYLEDRSKAEELSSFSEYLKPEEVQATVLDHHLKQVVDSSTRLFPRTS